ncbi:MAG: RNA methyltransferase [Lachnospiraceae bacterium]|nr:RNA methyltransferase [Lachnospiraceae bacterium]
MITSTANPQVKNLQQLMKKSSVRREQGVFLAEGVKMLLEAPPERIRKIYVSKSLYEEKGQAFFPHADLEILDDRVYRAVSDTKTPQGVLCLIERFSYTLTDFTRKANPFLIILENLQDPGNLGTIIRTAEGAGADGVILSNDSVDIYNPKTIRATMGSVYRVPFLYADDLKEVLSDLKERGIRSYAAHLGGTCGYDEADYRRGCAFLIGNEGNGLTAGLSACADTLIHIPMHGKLESLNASVAAAILMYEACHQRSTRPT